MKLCSVDGCDRTMLAKGKCRRHYEKDRYLPKPGLRGSLEERFWKKVAKDTPNACWMWTAGKPSCGYGMIWGGSDRPIPLWAHRVSYELHHGSIPEGAVVMHSCDNPRCVNPAHLSLGTHGTNTKDKVAKGRHSHGIKHWNARLTDDDVRFIRANPERGVMELARQFEVSQPVISNIRAGKSWRHVN